jgi:iron(III) transport system ATP-binding protein
MNAGKIEQAGPPEEIYERPRSEFVARFIGSSNVLRGEARDEAHLSYAGSILRCTGGKLVPGQEAAIAVRQHAVRLWLMQPENMENILAGRVSRQVYLGANRDYLVEVAHDTELRVVAPAAENIPQGAAVWLHLPPDRCRILSG